MPSGVARWRGVGQCGGAGSRCPRQAGAPRRHRHRLDAGQRQESPPHGGTLSVSARAASFLRTISAGTTVWRTPKAAGRHAVQLRPGARVCCCRPPTNVLKATSSAAAIVLAPSTARRSDVSNPFFPGLARWPPGDRRPLGSDHPPAGHLHRRQRHRPGSHTMDVGGGWTVQPAATRSKSNPCRPTTPPSRRSHGRRRQRHPSASVDFTWSSASGGPGRRGPLLRSTDRTTMVALPLQRHHHPL